MPWVVEGTVNADVGAGIKRILSACRKEIGGDRSRHAIVREFKYE